MTDKSGGLPLAALAEAFQELVVMRSPEELIRGILLRQAQRDFDEGKFSEEVN